MQQQLAKSQNDMNEQLKRTNEALTENERISEEIETIKLSKQNLQQELNEIKIQNNKLEFTLNEKNKRIQNLEERAQSRLNDTSEMQHAYELIRNELDKITKEKADNEIEYREKIESLEKENAEMKQNLQSSSLNLRKLMKQRDKTETIKRNNDKKIMNLEEENSNLKQQVKTLEKERNIKLAKSDKTMLIYIRKVLLQFFIQDGSTRESLIPVVLNLVECDEKTIRQAQRSWRESNQIISHLFKF